MQLKEAIRRLQAMLDKHGDVDVYFDCPTCRKSFTPNTLVSVAVHMTQEPIAAPGKE